MLCSVYLRLLVLRGGKKSRLVKLAMYVSLTEVLLKLFEG